MTSDIHSPEVVDWTDLGRETFARGVLEAIAQHESEIFGKALARR